MPSPFPGMDPYLENPAHWPDVHNSLVASIREELAPLVAPRYYIGLERRGPDDLVFLGRPELYFVRKGSTPAPGSRPEITVIDVEVPITDEVGESYLEIREAAAGSVVTVIELLSPVNKKGSGSEEYLAKRDQVLRSRSSLVEIDLLRSGKPLPLVQNINPSSHYRILVSRSSSRPRAQLYPFQVTQPIPSFPLPLGTDEDEPLVHLNEIFQKLYDRVHFELLVDYTRPPSPPLRDPDLSSHS